MAHQTWAGSHRKQQQQDATAAEREQQQQEDGEAQQDVQEQLLAGDAAAAAAAAADADLVPSHIAARLAATQLDELQEGLAGAEGDEARVLASQLPPEQANALRAELDARLRDAASASAGGEGSGDAAAAAYGREMWGRCEALVAGLAGELTEQLRLILEPSLASRLGGEFRSGKRLNMKRVIGYIASQFRRDKIWMRRARPDKRRYQVLLAVDDSRSMAQHGAAGFALEALSLLCKAMSRLEVGELGVISYGGGGGGVVPLQPLDATFSDAAGPAIMSALRFDQDNTIADRPMLTLVEAVQHLLEGARLRAGSQGSGGSSSGSDLRQLLLVLGDGRFHEKDALVGAVRRLVEVQGVCPVFIALDTAATTTGSGSSDNASGSNSGGRAPSSLLDMQSVKFVDGKPVFERYMDTFPFPYYIVLRDIAALPATLADLLRQWFELNASST
jgi:midasin